MKKNILSLFTVFLIIQFSLLLIGKTFARADKKGSKVDTTSSVAPTSDGAAPYVKGMTKERGKALVGVTVGLISLVIGWRAKVRSAKGIGNGRNGATAALLIGLIGIFLGIAHLISSAGAAFGTGKGKAGAIVTVVLALIGMTFGGLTLRQKKT